MTNQGIGLYLRATGGMYWYCMKEATRLLWLNWPLLVGSVIAYLIVLLAYALFGGMGFGGGFLVGFVQIGLVSAYYSWISDSLRSEKLKFSELHQFDYSLFFTVISAAFILFIAEFLFQTLAGSSGEEWILYLVKLGIVLVFNALPETIYLHRFENLQALGHAAEFTRENWIEWYIPYLILLLPVLLLSPQITLYLLSGSEVLMPAQTIFAGLSLLAPLLPGLFHVIAVLLAVVIANWYMLFRGLLFKELEGGTRRKRMFDARD